MRSSLLGHGLNLSIIEWRFEETSTDRLFESVTYQEW
jgi:hypothetical protein